MSCAIAKVEWGAMPRSIQILAMLGSTVDRLAVQNMLFCYPVCRHVFAKYKRAAIQSKKYCCAEFVAIVVPALHVTHPINLNHSNRVVVRDADGQYYM